MAPSESTDSMKVPVGTIVKAPDPEPRIPDHFSIPGTLDLYLGDALQILPTLHEKVDLLIADPPYGVNWRSNHRRQKFDPIHGDRDALDVPELMRSSLKMLTSNKHVYVFGPWEPLDAISSLTVIEELVWDKCMMSGGNLASPWGPSHERINFGVYCPSKANRDRGDGRLSARLRKGSVLRVPRFNASGVKRHPTEKPVRLLRMLIESSTAMGDWVLDPCFGSGSTIEAAILEGRRVIGIEIIPKYYYQTILRILEMPAFSI